MTPLTRTTEFTEMESRVVGGWGRGMENCGLLGAEVQFCRMKRVLETACATV